MPIRSLLKGLLLSSLTLPAFAELYKLPLTKTDSGHFAITANINEVTGNFILDTGASGTVVDSAKLTKFNISNKGEVVAGMAAGSAESGALQSQEILLNSVAINGITIDMNNAYSHDISGQFGFRL